jgi:hypothetical protein
MMLVAFEAADWRPRVHLVAAYGLAYTQELAPVPASLFCMPMPYYTLNTENNAVRGPFTASQLLELLNSHELSESTPAAPEGADSWSVLGDLRETLREEFEQEVHAVLQSGPPSSPLIRRLLKEDGHFPFARPRGRTRTP